MPFKAQRAVWDKLLEVADVSSLNEEEKAQYHRALKNYRDYHNVMATARKEGLKEGLEKGLAQGREEERLRTARAMMAKGYRPEEIAELLSMDIETFRQL